MVKLTDYLMLLIYQLKKKKIVNIPLNVYKKEKNLKDQEKKFNLKLHHLLFK